MSNFLKEQESPDKKSEVLESTKINKLLNLEIMIEQPEHDENGQIIPKRMFIEDPLSCMNGVFNSHLL